MAGSVLRTLGRFALLTGDTDDDTQAVSAGTGSPLPVVSGTEIPNAAEGDQPYFDGTEWATGPNVWIDPLRPPYNAIADGDYHALSSRYATLAEAQAAYPDAGITALTQQIDWAAVQQAVKDAEAAGGGVIHLRRKSYVCQSQVQWADNVHCFGVSETRTAIDGNTSKGSVITNYSTGTLVGATFTANTSSSSTTLSNISSFASLYPNCPISGTGIAYGTYVVSVNTGANTAVLSKAATATGTGVTITPGKAMVNTSGCKNWGFHNVAFHYVGSQGGNVAMAISDFEGEGASLGGLSHLHRCTFNNFGGTAQVGFYGNVMHILECRFDQSVGHAIALVNPVAVLPATTGVGTDGFVAYNSTGFTYQNNQFGAGTGAAGDGLKLDYGGFYLVANNDFYNCRYGINLVYSAGNRVIGNRCEKNDEAGIQLSGTGNYPIGNTIMGNLCWNNGYGTASAGIAVNGSANRSAVIGNLIWNQNDGQDGTNDSPCNKGIAVSGSASRITVVGNMIMAVNTIGIQFDSVTYSKIADNFIDTCGRQGIYLGNSSSYNEINDNIVYNAGQETTNQFDGIAVVSTGAGDACVNNKIDGCRVVTPATNKPRYGIAIVNSNTTGSHVLNCYCVGGNHASGAFNTDAPTSTIVRNFRGYTVGSITVSVPSSGVAIAAVAYDRYFYVTTSTGSTTIAISNGPTVTLQASTAGQLVFCPAGQTLTPTYANAPTWVTHGYAD